MNRFQVGFKDEELMEKIRAEMKELGLSTVAAFIVYAVIKYFKK